MQKILVSACLLGQRVRYDGGCRLAGNAVLRRWHEEGRIIALCPEVASGFATPRPPAEVQAGYQGDDVIAGAAQVLESTGRSVTALYLEAARIALDLANQHGCRHAVLTDGSPSCGSTYIYDGTFAGVVKPGRGATAALLEANGIRVFPETALGELDRMIRCGAENAESIRGHL